MKKIEVKIKELFHSMKYGEVKIIENTDTEGVFIVRTWLKVYKVSVKDTAEGQAIYQVTECTK